MRDEKHNAHRLARTLYNRSADTVLIRKLAIVLDYMPEQLAEDMRALSSYIETLENAQA